MRTQVISAQFIRFYRSSTQNHFLSPCSPILPIFRSSFPKLISGHQFQGATSALPPNPDLTNRAGAFPPGDIQNIDPPPGEDPIPDMSILRPGPDLLSPLIPEIPGEPQKPEIPITPPPNEPGWTTPEFDPPRAPPEVSPPPNINPPPGEDPMPDIPIRSPGPDLPSPPIPSPPKPEIPGEPRNPEIPIPPPPREPGWTPPEVDPLRAPPEVTPSSPLEIIPPMT